MFRLETRRSRLFFDVLERPNEWNRRLQEASRTGERARAAQLKREFWAHYLATHPDAPIPSSYSHHTFSHYVGEADLRIHQYVAFRDVGTYLKASRNETEEDFEERIEPYRELFESRIEDISNTEGGSWWAESRYVGSTRDRNNWDQMADWLDDQRQEYEEILRSGPGV